MIGLMLSGMIVMIVYDVMINDLFVFEDMIEFVNQGVLCSIELFDVFIDDFDVVGFGDLIMMIVVSNFYVVLMFGEWVLIFFVVLFVGLGVMWLRCLV